VEFSHQITLEQSADAVFALLIDLDRVAPCLAGAELLGTRPDGSRDGRVTIGLGPMTFTYTGVIDLVRTDPSARVAVLRAGGSEASGAGTAEADITLTVASLGANRSKLTIDTDVVMKGGAASLGRGLMDDVAEETLEDFAKAIGVELSGHDKAAVTATATSHQPSDAGTAAVTPIPVRPAPRPATKMSGGALVARVARRRIKRLRRKLLAALQRRTLDTSKRSGQQSEYDLAIVGTGSGALAAAIVAHDAGLRVVIFEKAPVVGGGTAYSGGVIWAPDNHIMRRKGLEDSVEEAMTYLRHAAGGRGNEAIQRSYVTNVRSVIEQVEGWTGVKWVIWTGQPDYYPDLPGAKLSGRAILPHPAAASDRLTPLEGKFPDLALVRSTPHMDFVPGFQQSDRPARHSWLAGRSIIGGLWLAVLERGIEFHTSTPAVDLIQDGDAVVGVVVQPEGQPSREVRAGAVLLNTGGFDWNEKLARRYLPGPVAHPQTPPANTGDGHIMAMKVGAGTALMDKAVWHPAIKIEGDTHDEGQQLYRMFNMELSKPHSMLVNKGGHRFASEAAYYAVADAWATIDTLSREYPNVPSFIVVDEEYRRKYGFPGVAEDGPLPGWIKTADTIEGLAEELGIDAAALPDEVAEFNIAAEHGVDEKFHRGRTAYEKYWGDPEWEGPNPTMGPVSKAPFYGWPVYFSHAGTRGGVTISPTGQALRADGTPIPGLYVSGNTAANELFGGGYASGSAVGSSMVFGYLSAHDVVDRVRAQQSAG
jgi:succinate dehydrogenase/fumarate reductase flavoprotein subunit/carbon monoxide dehydrogenase subunit G